MLSYYMCIQCKQSKLQGNHDLHEGREGLYERMHEQLPKGGLPGIHKWSRLSLSESIHWMLQI